MCFDPWVWELPSLTLLGYMALTFHTLPYLRIPTPPTVLGLSPYSILMTFFPALGYLIIPTHPYCTGPYLILFHPTRSLVYHTQPVLNTILHLYKILLPYTTLSYHIEIEPNRPTAETSRIGTPSKFTQAEKSRPKQPKLCCLHSQNAEIIWTGLQSHSSAKKRFFLARIYGKIGSSPHSIKM